MKSMAVDKNKRFQSMDELRCALEKFLLCTGPGPSRHLCRPATSPAGPCGGFFRALRQISCHKLLIPCPERAKQVAKQEHRGETLARIDAFLKLGMQQGCSDVHLAVGVPPMLRMHGDLLPIKFRDLRVTELEGYITEILTRSQAEHFSKGNDLDFSYVSAEGGRFRVNVYRKETGIGATFRAIPSEVPSLEKLALPPS
jgi:hypothetical protein